MPEISGIYQYTENESVAPGGRFSELLNKLGNSVRNTVTSLSMRVGALETGNDTVHSAGTFWAPPTGQDVRVRFRGKRVQLVGTLVRRESTVTASTATLGTVAAAARPPSGVTRRCVIATSAGVAQLEVASSGTLTVTWPSSVTLTAGTTTIHLDGASWEVS